MKNRYNEKGDIIGTTEKGNQDMGDIIADITTSFLVIAGIFFPSVTGISVQWLVAICCMLNVFSC